MQPKIEKTINLGGGGVGSIVPTHPEEQGCIWHFEKK